MKLTADKIFINAKAYTLEAEGVVKEAIVIKDGKICIRRNHRGSPRKIRSKRSHRLGKVRQCSRAWETPTCISSHSARLSLLWIWEEPRAKKKLSKGLLQRRRKLLRASGSKVPTLTSPSGKTAKTSPYQGRSG